MNSTTIPCGARLRALGVAALATLLAAVPGCDEEDGPKLEAVAHLDLQRYMGSWYVVSMIPTFLEEGAVNAVESYTLKEDGSIGIRYGFRRNTPDGARKSMRGEATVFDTTSGAEWRVQFYWPFKLPYLVIDLDPDYRYAVVGEPGRKYAWIMSRSPELDRATYEAILARVAAKGYDVSRFQEVAQVWR